ncbi:MAG: SpaH/EbpB family LPXTG-anchored major pilin [Arcanobacterium sp.]|nr:SpaH/EbpB family LPXTG-anchored major pilin [Arcanobacterium sp.]
MVAKPTGVKRILALTLAFALTFILGSMSLVQNAFAADLGNMPTGPGSLTIHKYDNNPRATQPGNGTKLVQPPSNTPLSGVKFSVAKVEGLDLTNNNDWAKVAGLTYNEQAKKVTSGGQEYQTAPATEQATNGGGETTFSNLAIGAYLVIETDPGANAVTKKVAPFFVTVPFPNAQGDWITDVHVYPKNDVNTPGTKEVQDDSNLKAIGDEIPWVITTTATQAKPSKYGIVDQLQSYLTYVNDSAAVKVGNQVLDSADFTVTTSNTPVKNVKIALTPSGLAKVSAGDTVVFTLKTKLTALPPQGVVKNAAWPIDGEYDPFSEYNPDNPKPPIVPTEDPKYGEYKFKKIDAQTPAKPLSGAEFKIYADRELTKELATATSNDQGIVVFDGIYIGKGDQATQRVVYLKETKAPAGFMLNDAVKEITLVPGTHQLSEQENVVNTPQNGPKLPLTGAAGTALLTIAGIAVLALAGGLAFANIRRKNA